MKEDSVQLSGPSRCPQQVVIMGKPLTARGSGVRVGSRICSLRCRPPTG